MTGNDTLRVALVTGGSGGIGTAVSRRLARDGLAIVVNYAGNATVAGMLAQSIEDSGGRAKALQGDVSDPDAVRRLFAAAEETYGGVDVLVNVAGVMPLANVADTDDAMFERVIAINLRGTFNTLREAAKRLRPNGRIINFSSSVVGLLMPTYAVYAAAKAGVEAMTTVLAKELRGRNITVNAIAPGPTATELFFKGKSQGVIDHFAKMPPLERLGRPEDIANAVAFLAGPDGSWINGQSLRANGGVI
jgi:3-oxoacyl-[acyl-carrier protein] reductase